MNAHEQSTTFVGSFVRSMVAGFCTSLKVKRPCRRVPRDQLLLLSPRTPKLYTILILTINMKQQTPGVLKLSLPGMQQTQEDWVGRHLHAEVNSCGTNVRSGIQKILLILPCCICERSCLKTGIFTAYYTC